MLRKSGLANTLDPTELNQASRAILRDAIDLAGHLKAATKAISIKSRRACYYDSRLRASMNPAYLPGSTRPSPRRKLFRKGQTFPSLPQNSVQHRSRVVLGSGKQPTKPARATLSLSKSMATYRSRHTHDNMQHGLKSSLSRKLSPSHAPPPAPLKHLTRCLRKWGQASLPFPRGASRSNAADSTVPNPTRSPAPPLRTSRPH